MSESGANAISADAVKQAGEFIVKSLDRAEIDAARSPVFDQLAAAKREADPATRAAMVAKAHKDGLRNAHAEKRRLQANRDQRAADAGEPEYTPEALREMEALKSRIRGLMRKKVEEEIARTYPEVESGKKRRAPRRNKLDI